MFLLRPRASTQVYTLSLHDALPISEQRVRAHHDAGLAGGDIQQRAAPRGRGGGARQQRHRDRLRSEEHTSELQSRGHLVCRLLLEKKNIIISYMMTECQAPRTRDEL